MAGRRPARGRRAQGWREPVSCAAPSSSRVPTSRRRRWPCCRISRSSTPARRHRRLNSSNSAAATTRWGIIVRYGKVGAAVMDAAPSLRVISKHGSGTDTIDKNAASARGIEVRAAAGANAAAVAEQALALLLACAKSVVQLNERMHAGHWDKPTHKSVELHGRTIGRWAPLQFTSGCRPGRGTSSPGTHPSRGASLHGPAPTA